VGPRDWPSSPVSLRRGSQVRHHPASDPDDLVLKVTKAATFSLLAMAEQNPFEDTAEGGPVEGGPVRGRRPVRRPLFRVRGDELEDGQGLLNGGKQEKVGPVPTAAHVSPRRSPTRPQTEPTVEVTSKAAGELPGTSVQAPKQAPQRVDPFGRSTLVAGGRGRVARHEEHRSKPPPRSPSRVQAIREATMVRIRAARSLLREGGDVQTAFFAPAPSAPTQGAPSKSSGSRVGPEAGKKEKTAKEDTGKSARTATQAPSEGKGQESGKHGAKSGDHPQCSIF
jgi:hypothetical protein